jgi:hypothetical protein
MDIINFEDIQKVWDKQKGKVMYIIDESALRKSVIRKKDTASKRIRHNEISVSIINGIMAIFLFVIALYGEHNWAFLSSGLMAATVAYIQYFRWKRKQVENTFDRSMLGEIDHAISNTNSIIKFNYVMLLGFLTPLTGIYISKMIAEGAGLEKWLITTGMILLALFLSRWEQKACNIPRRKDLLALKKKLIEE